MLQLVNPLLLFSLLGLLVPVAIHLWSRKAGKRVKIGSIALLQQAPSKQMRSIRMHELVLLLLRCLLLALIVLLITQPEWLSARKANQPGWILISPEVAAQVKQDRSLKEAIDSLQQKGFETRFFQQGFRRLDVNQVDITRTQPSTSYWSLLKEAAGQLPAGTSVFAFTHEYIQHFKGKRPAINIDLHWITVPVSDTTTLWLADAFTDSSDSLYIQVGVSKPVGNTYRQITSPVSPAPVTLTQPGMPAIRITPQNGTYQISLADDSHTILADTASLYITLYADADMEEDARYVSAALKAIAAFIRRKIQVSQVKQTGQIPSQTHWLFWFSDKPLPKPWQQKIMEGMQVVQYASTANVNTINTWLHIPAQSGNTIYLNRLSEVKAEGIALWESSMGNPVLTKQKTGKGNLYRLYSRFHPSWNGLVWHPSFAETLLDLLYGTKRPAIPKDLRIINQQQLMPTKDNSTQEPETIKQTYSLHPYLWFVILLLFVLERWVSQRKQVITERQKSNKEQVAS